MRKLVIILLVLLFANFANGQDVAIRKDVKVGLVLSGGGAKGLAHIGALKIIEEAGVKIDYVGGTSMGAIIGALYASGYSATELDSIFRNTSLGNLIQDNLPRSAKTFYEKEDSERYAITLPFNNFKISVPTAYSGGQNIYNEFVRLLYHVKDVENFKDLPKPFVCIATNVETGKEVVLDKGYLPEAIMASGTLPSLFEPASVKGELLIDGGIVNNYPIDQVRALGADVVIGVDVQHGLSARDELLSATEVLFQISNYRAATDMQKKSEETDVYIKPNIAEYSVLDFGKQEAIIETGKNAAIKKFSELKTLAFNQLGRKKAIKKTTLQDTLIVSRLIIDGSSNYSRGYVKGKLRFSMGEEITFDKLQQGISNLSATGNFHTNRFKLLKNGIGQDLILNLEEKPTKTFIRLGAHYDDLYKSAAIINLTRKNFLTKDDVASFDFILGDNVRYNMQYYIDKGTYWSFGFNSRFNAFDEEIDFSLIQNNYDVMDVSSINRINIDVTDLTNQIYVQTVLKEELSFTLGVEHKFLKYSTRTLSDNQPIASATFSTSSDKRTVFEKSNYLSAYSQLVFDTYDDRYFPTKGLNFNGDFHFYLWSSDFTGNFKEFSISNARIGAAWPITKKLALNVETDGGFKLGTSTVATFDYVLGGYGGNLINSFTPFLGYDFLSLPGNSYVKAYARLDYEIAPKNHVLLAANYANVEDDIFRTGEWFTTPNFSGYGIGYGLESFVGPIQLMYSWSPEGKKGHLFISLGYWF
ncbi:patatin-like phospholipase family protein [uncultured Maribacter sp.]|uniref:patatin-like phospholipase family protein n=1 Tax=uncultured Maribacter sp. TaxID=431308 RepID=UPI00262D55F9|nr:patatin-like phospholipase family protein [uncultured Maribacter sp.]